MLVFRLVLTFFYCHHIILHAQETMFADALVALQAALSNTGIPKVNVIAADPTSASDQPEVDVSDEEFLQFDTSAVPVIITLTKVPHPPFTMTLKTLMPFE